MDRADTGSNPLLVDTQTGQVLLSTGDLIQEAEPGVRIGLMLLDDGGYDVEFSYLGLDTFGDPITRNSNNPITFAFFGGVPANPQNSYSVDYRSELNSGEINLRKRFGPQVSWLAGFRFIELRATLQYRPRLGWLFLGHRQRTLWIPAGRRRAMVPRTPIVDFQHREGRRLL